jgi:hypothetical protein
LQEAFERHAREDPSKLIEQINKKEKLRVQWLNQVQLPAHAFRCGYCSREVASNQGFQLHSVSHRRAYVCPNCDCPSYFDREQQTPKAVLGAPIGHLPSDIESLLKEARDCVAAGANTAAVLLARKMLMHIAVAQGASEGERSFSTSSTWRLRAGYLRTGSIGSISFGRRATSRTMKLVVMTAVDATEILSFLEILLIFVYDFPNRVPKPPV